MQKIIFITFLCISNLLFSQAVEKGSFTIEPYAGFPNLSKIILKNIDRVYESDVSSKGPFGVKADYFFNDKVSIGVNFIYNSYNIYGKIDSLINEHIDTTYAINVDMKRFRFQVNAKYHLFVGEKFDSYIGFGIGSNTRKYTIDTSYPNLDEQSVFATLVPVSARFDIGASFFLAKNVGLNIELGVGGPLILTGIFVKIP